MRMDTPFDWFDKEWKNSTRIWLESTKRAEMEYSPHKLLNGIERNLSDSTALVIQQWFHQGDEI
jgi:hypothetical protein